MVEGPRLSAAQRSKIRRLSQPKELAPDEEGGELNIVPFLDIVMNILIFVLATVSVTFTATIETTPTNTTDKLRITAPQYSLKKDTRHRWRVNQVGRLNNQDS